MTDEFSDRTTRGSMSASLETMFGLGSAIVYGLGTVLNWKLTAGISAILSFTTMIIFYFLPESAVWLIRKNRLLEGRHSLNWSYGSGCKTKALLEFEDMVRKHHAEEYHRRIINTSISLNVRVLKYLNMCLAPHVLKPFLISIVFSWSQVFIGAHLFIVYAVDLVSSTMSKNDRNMEDNIIAIVTGIVRAISLASTTIVLYWVGRRSLAIGFALLCSASALAIGTIIYTQKHGYSSLSNGTEKWVMIILIILYIATSSGGFLLLPYIMTGELLPNKFRGFLSGMVYGSCDLLSGGIITLYPRLSSFVGSNGMFWIFGITSLASSLFLYLFLPETQGKTLSDIEDYFKQKNKIWLKRVKTETNESEMFINVKDSLIRK